MSVDTLSIAQDLRAADLAAPQAEAIASAIGRALGDNAASKGDLDGVEQRFSASLENVEQRFSTKLENVEQRFSAKLENVEQRLNAKLEAFRSSMLVWFIGTQVAVGALIVALVKL